jgi:hypothetical protein
MCSILDIYIANKAYLSTLDTLYNKQNNFQNNYWPDLDRAVRSGVRP